VLFDEDSGQPGHIFHVELKQEYGRNHEKLIEHEAVQEDALGRGPELIITKRAIIYR
jgi:hypothetical protein